MLPFNLLILYTSDRKAKSLIIITPGDLCGIAVHNPLPSCAGIKFCRTPP